MVSPRRIRVMISSRCNDLIDLDGVDVKLSVVRMRLKEELQEAQLLGSPLFEVWINEDAPAADGSEDSWDHCLRQVADADLVIALYNGNSGWARHGGDVGICHAELDRALATAPAKTRLIELPLHDLSTVTPEQSARDTRFRKWVDARSLFRGAPARNGSEMIAEAKKALREAVGHMVSLGGREARRGKFHTGGALDWSRLDFSRRREAMRATLCDALSSRTGSGRVGAHPVVGLAGLDVLVSCHAIPASMTTQGALDLAHQPFLRDHELAALLADTYVGPVHMIACHRSVTETQAVKQLGFTDATIVSAPFGIYVADGIQKIQLIFIGNCRDETSTRHGVQRFFDWLEQTDETTALADRAAARARIVKAIAAEM